MPKAKGSDADADGGAGKQVNGETNGDADGEAKQQLDGDEEMEERWINMGGKNTASMKAGERIVIMTPGGGGWGPVGKEKESGKSLQDPKHGWKGGSVASRQSEAEASA